MVSKINALKRCEIKVLTAKRKLKYQIRTGKILQCVGGNYGKELGRAFWQKSNWRISFSYNVKWQAVFDFKRYLPMSFRQGFRWTHAHLLALRSLVYHPCYLSVLRSNISFFFFGFFFISFSTRISNFSLLFLILCFSSWDVYLRFFTLSIYCFLFSKLSFI